MRQLWQILSWKIAEKNNFDMIRKTWRKNINLILNNG